MTNSSGTNGTPILLAHSYFLRYDAKQMRKMKPYPPLATLLSAATLRKQGFDVRLFDAMLAQGVEQFYQKLDQSEVRIVGLLEDNFNFLTKMCTVRMREAGLDMIRAAKARGCRVAVNGSDATDHPDIYIDAGADAVIIGEPEQTLTDLVIRWSKDPASAIHDVPGLAIKARNTNGHRETPDIVRTNGRGLVQNLDDIPFPAWDLIDTQQYRDAWMNEHKRFSWNVATSRGCPYKCNWCAKPLFGTRYAQRSPANVAEELQRLRETVAPDHLWFTDDIFGLTSRWIEEFAAEVIARDAVIPFTMQSRVNLMKPTVVDALARAGAEEVWLGVESGSQKVLDAMDKGTKIEQVRGATRTLQTHGIRSSWFIQLGYLGEDWEDIVLTRDLIREETPDDIGVSVSYPLPGTKFYETVQEQLGRTRNWTDSDNLAMMFQGTYSTEFYKIVRDLLHEEVDTNSWLDGRWSALEHQQHRHRVASPVVP